MTDTSKHTGKIPPPKRAIRHNEWTRQKMVQFLRELAACQSVAQAAGAVGMSRQSAYRLRNRLQGTPFSLGWEVALEMGYHQLAHAVMDRALNGVEEQRWYHGALVGTVRKFDNRLAQWVLENPWKLGRHQVAREYSAEAFDKLLERIEIAGFGWESGEHIPGPHVALGEYGDEVRRIEDSFMDEQSWYGSDAVGAARKRGNWRP